MQSGMRWHPSLPRQQIAAGVGHVPGTAAAAPHDPARLAALLRRADGQLKPAVVMHFRNIDLQGAVRILDDCNQSLRKAIEDVC